MNNILSYVYSTLIYPFIHGWTPELLPLLAAVNNAAVTISVQIYVQVLAFNSIRYIPKNRIAGSYGNSTVFEGLPYYFPW